MVFYRVAWFLFYLASLLTFARLIVAKHVFRTNQNDIGDNGNNGDLKVVCYYGSWAVYRPGNGKFAVEQIDPFLCSHIIYGFAGLSSTNKIRSLDPYNDLKENWGKGAFLRFNSLKQVNKKLKTLIAIGGWNEGSVKYSNMAASAESRQTFVKSVVDFLDTYGFDGLDFDWEYPGSRGGKASDKRNFVTLLSELKEAFRPKGYLLTAAVSAGKYNADLAYDIPQVSKYLDLINVMCYDYHGGWEQKTGHNSPLYARPDENGNERLLNVNYSINYWISNGAPRKKIILGMGTYGRSFTLSRPQNNGLGAPAPQKGQAGPYSREGGSLGYNELCEKRLKSAQQMTQTWDSYSMAPYASWGRQWVGFDNIESITIKAQYARAMGLGGGMIWSLETDDFRGECGDGKYPLLNSIKRVFDDSKVPSLPLPDSDTSKPSTTTTTQRPTTEITTTTMRTTTSTTTTTTQKPTTTERTSTTSSTTQSTTTKASTTSDRTTESISSTASSSETSSSTQNWWPHKSSTWWPQGSSTWWPTKGTEAVASSEVWWSSTPSSVRSNENPNSIAEETTPKGNSNSNADKEFICHDSGLYRNPISCTKFIRCVDTNLEGHFQLFFHECPDKTVFNNETKLCDWVENVPECIREVPRYYLRGTFQTKFGVVHSEKAPN